MVWAVRKVPPHINVGHPHRPIFSVSSNHSPAALVDDDPVVNLQEAREGVGHFREAVLRDITAGWLAFGKHYRRSAEGNTSAQGGGDSGGVATHNLTPLRRHPYRYVYRMHWANFPRHLGRLIARSATTPAAWRCWRRWAGPRRGRVSQPVDALGAKPVLFAGNVDRRTPSPWVLDGPGRREAAGEHQARKCLGCVLQLRPGHHISARTYRHAAAH